MFEMFAGAFGIGIAMSVPVGAFVIAASKRAITAGFRPAIVFTFGSLLGDAVYALLAYLGLAALLAANDGLRLALWLLGGAWLCWLGRDALRTRIDLNQLQNPPSTESTRQGFVSGFGLTMLNPLAIGGWMALAGSFFAGWRADWLPLYPFGLLAITTMLFGSLVYFVIFLGLLSWTRRFIRPRLLTAASILAGLTLIAFGLSAWWSAIQMIAT
jgi:L-lysine exporter family protein LysE/ArgO